MFLKDFTLPVEAFVNQGSKVLIGKIVNVSKVKL